MKRQTKNNLIRALLILIIIIVACVAFWLGYLYANAAKKSNLVLVDPLVEIGVPGTTERMIEL